MHLLKPILAMLLAWTLSFQAMAGVMGSHCRHPARAMPAQTSSTTDPHAGMHHGAKMSQQDGPHDHHAMGSTAHATVAKAILTLGCACGCDCMMLGCAGACPGLAAISDLSTFDFHPETPRAALAPTALAQAHVLDLIRPPSMS